MSLSGMNGIQSGPASRAFGVPSFASNGRGPDILNARSRTVPAGYFAASPSGMRSVYPTETSLDLPMRQMTEGRGKSSRSSIFPAASRNPTCRALP